MPKIPYLTGGEQANPARMNALFGEFDTRLGKILGGRSPALAIVSGSFASGSSGGHTTFSYGGVPYLIFGKCFFFVSGRTAYSQFLPGALPVSRNVADPVTAVVTSQPSVLTYDHAVFSTALAAQSALSYDETNKVAVISDVAETPYYPLPQYWWRITGNMGFFEHSLEAHTVEKEGARYFVRETSAPVPEKVYDWSLAEIVIEGPTSVNLAVCPLERFKYKNLRLHNLGNVACSVSLPDASTVALGPFECKSYRLNVAGTAFEASTMRYFQTFRDNDPRMFWFWGGLPAKTGQTVMGMQVNYNLTPATNGMQGNNLVNPAVIYDWVSWLTQDGNNAQFYRDVHEVCDITARYLDKFADPADPNTALVDLLFHKGTIIVVKISKTLKDAQSPTTPLATFIPVEYRTFATLQDDFQAAGALITVGADGSGNLKLSTTDPDWVYHVVGVGCNFLKGFTHIVAPGVPEQYTSFIQSGIVVSGQSFQEPIVLESQGAAQDVQGSSSFTFSNRSNYRIRQWTQAAVPSSVRSYTNLDGSVVTLSFPNQHVIAQGSSVTAKTLTGIHNVSVSDITNLSLFGNPSLSNQSNGTVTFTDVNMLFTPEGLVLTFKERISSSLLESLTAKRTIFTIGGFLVRTWMENFAGRKYESTTNGWELKHVVRFRGHGFGWGQHGRANAAWFSPHYGRQSVSGLTGEVVSPNGHDFGFPDQHQSETAVKLLRRVSVPNDLGNTLNGGRLFLCGYKNLDAINQFAANYSARFAGIHPWYLYTRPLIGSMAGRILSGNSAVQRLAFDGPGLLMLPLLVDHYNGMAQCVNQLKTGRVLDWRSLKLVWGSIVFDFGTVKTCVEGTANNRFAYSFNYEHAPYDIRTIPSPMDAFCRVDTVTDSRGTITFNAGLKQLMQSRGVTIKRGVPLNNEQTTFQSKLRDIKRFTTASFLNGRVINPRVIQTGDIYYKWTWDQVVDKSQSYFVSMSDERSSSRPPGAAAVCLPLSPEEYVMNDGTRVRDDSGLIRWNQLLGDIEMVNLSGYAAVEWVSITDIKSWFQSIGFPFVYIEVVYPMNLKTLETPTSIHESSFFPTVMGSSVTTVTVRTPYHITFDGTKDTPAAFWLSQMASIESTIYYAVGNSRVDTLFTILSKFQGFVLHKQQNFSDPSDSPLFKWPIQFSDVSVYDPIAGNVEIFDRLNDRAANRGRFPIIDAAAFEFGVVFFGDTRLPNSGITLRGGFLSNSPPYFTDTVGGFACQYKAAFELDDFTGGNGFEHYMKWLNRETLFFAINLASTNPTATHRVTLTPKAMFGYVPDWWLSDADSWIACAVHNPYAKEHLRVVPAPASVVEIACQADRVTPISVPQDTEGAYYFTMPPLTSTVALE